MFWCDLQLFQTPPLYGYDKYSVPNNMIYKSMVQTFFKKYVLMESNYFFFLLFNEYSDMKVELQFVETIWNIEYAIGPSVKEST